MEGDRTLQIEYRVDLNRIYVTGRSKGAMMAYRLASELADQISAIDPVAGAMATKTCHPLRPVSVVHFHGTKDQFSPFEGGLGTRNLVNVAHLSVDHSMRSWVQANGCCTEGIEFRVPNRVDAGTLIRSVLYENGKEGSEVLLHLVEGGGHTWPGRRTPLERLGNSTQNISASELMWTFFQRHQS